MIGAKIFHLIVTVLATVFGWVPFIGPRLIIQRKRNEFQHTFGVSYWQTDAVAVSQKRVSELREAWMQTGYDPKKTKQYAYSQKVAGFLHELRA